jgi:hypothetical protein
LPVRERGSGWDALRGLVREQATGLRAPRPGAPGQCAVCHGFAGPRRTRCYQCDLHLQCAQGHLADVIVPVAFAIKGSAHARRLWMYKSSRVAANAAGTAGAQLLALLLVFLRDHGGCAWRAAGAGQCTHVAVVPTAKSRPGMHPLRTLIAPHLDVPWAELAARPGSQHLRDLDPGRFSAAPLPAARVLLIDDTWATGASAQSAAIALRRAGARSVATVVLGRHVSPRAAASAAFAPVAGPFCARTCAVHSGLAERSGP